KARQGGATRMGMVRIVITILVAFGVALAAGEATLAQTYPNRPIRIVVPYPAGGPTDVVARLVGGKMSAMLGQPVIVDNRTVGAKVVSTSEPDGYTLLMSQVGALTISPSIYKLPDSEVTKVFAPVALVTVSPQLLCITPSLPVKSLAEFIAYAKANPGKVNF